MQDKTYNMYVQYAVDMDAVIIIHVCRRRNSSRTQINLSSIKCKH